MKKVFIVHANGAYVRLFQRLGYESYHDVLTEDGKVDLVVFTGGEDVSPDLYNHKQHPSTYSNIIRDTKEAGVFHTAVALGIPMVGICRGAQFLNVMSGGTMYQDVTKHTQSHSITDLLTGEEVFVSSTHHQMMKPSEKGLLVASSAQGGTREFWNGEIFEKNVSEEDIEVVYYEHTKCLCFQPHPEFESPIYGGMELYFVSLLERFL